MGCDVSFSALTAGLHGGRLTLISAIELARRTRQAGASGRQVDKALAGFARFLRRRDIANYESELSQHGWVGGFRDLWLDVARGHMALAVQEVPLALGLQIVTTLERITLRQVSRLGAPGSAEAARQLIYVLHRASGKRNTRAPRFNRQIG
jgi:hypothetical protein